MNKITIGYNAQFMHAICAVCQKTLSDLNKQDQFFQAVCKECWDLLAPELRSEIDVPPTRLYFVRDFQN